MADRTKPFPMLDGPSIDWRTAEFIHEAYRGLGHDQSLDRIAERGGFGWSEVKTIFGVLSKAPDPRRRALGPDIIRRSRRP